MPQKIAYTIIYQIKIKIKIQEERRGDEQENATWKHRLESVTKGQRAVSKFELRSTRQ